MSGAPSSLLGDRLAEAGAGGVETLRTYLAARQATSEEKKKTKAPTSGNVPTEGRQQQHNNKRGIASGQGPSSSPLFMEMCLVPSFKLWLGNGGCFN